MGVAEPTPDAVPGGRGGASPAPHPPSAFLLRHSRAGNGSAPEGTRPLRPDPWPRRVADVGLAAVLLVLSLPLLASGALAVLLLSGRPVLYGHPRVGRGGRRFRCWKLRTMEVHAEDRLRRDPSLHARYRDNGYKLLADPRTTVPGRWLRRAYLDELPQLFNVLTGSMSLVGPRPVVEPELQEYGDGVDDLLSVRPGIFGAWNCLGRDRPGYPARARIELEYVRRRSLRRDAAILLRSMPVVMRGYPHDV